MKKTLAAILALVLTLSLCSIAWAETCDKGDSCTEHVAKIGNEHYDSLVDAISAVPANGQSPTLITILKDVTDANGLTIRDNKNIVIDFNNHVYTIDKPGAGSKNTETNGFQLIKGTTIVFKNGTINVSENNLTPAVPPAGNIKVLIQNYCDLTLENMTLDGSNLMDNYVLSLNCGNVLITGKTNISGKKNGVALDVMHWENATYKDSGVHVTIDKSVTGTIDGTIDVYCYRNDAVVKPVDDNGATLKIFGGTFSSNPAAYVTDATLAVTKGSDGKYTVSEAKVTDDKTAPEVVLPAGSSGATTIPASDVDANKNLTIKGDSATIMFDQEAASAIKGKASDGDLTLTAKDVTNAIDSLGEGIKSAYLACMKEKSAGSEKVMEFSLTMGQGSESMFTNGTATVTVPYKANQKNVEVFWLQNGEAAKLDSVSSVETLQVGQFYYNSTTGEVTMMLPHFSAYLIASDGQTSSGNYYYYPSTTTDTTKTNSPKTFDAGVALYAGMALASLTGLAYTGKKKF